MTHGTQRTTRIGLITLLGLLLSIGVFLPGCGIETVELPDDFDPDETFIHEPEVEPEPEVDVEPEPAVDVEPIEEEPEPVAEVEPQGLLAQIEAADDFVALHELEQEYKESDDHSEVIDQAFAAKWEDITADMESRTLVDGLDILSVHTEATGAEEYTFSFLFLPTEKLDTNYHLSVRGYVFPSHILSLPESRQEHGHDHWIRTLMDEESTSKWDQNTYRIVRLKRNVPNIPYNLHIQMHTRDSDNRWIEGTGRILPIGWQWAVWDNNQFISRVESCNSPAELYAIAPPGPAVDPSITRVVDAKWERLVSELDPQPMLEVMDYLGVETEAISDREYSFSFLFKANKDIESDYHLGIIARVDPSHVEHIDSSGDDADYTTWTLFLYDNPTSLWKGSEYHVGQLRVETKIIPFNLNIGWQTRDENRRYVDGAGERVDIGWQADLSE